jgi:hypothetical protein
MTAKPRLQDIFAATDIYSHVSVLALYAAVPALHHITECTCQALSNSALPATTVLL